MNRAGRRLLSVLISVLSLWLLAPLPAFAQQFTDFQVTPGTGSKNNANTLIAQSFTTNAAAASIVSLDLYANNNGLAAGNFTLSLYAASGSAGSYRPTGNALFSATYSNTVLGSVVGSNTVFSGLNWSVSGNTTYLIAFESSPTATVKWKAAATSETGNLLAGYTGQNRYEGNPESFSPGSLHAMTVTTSAIPEPGTYALLAGLAALGAAVIRHRRRS